MELAAQELGTGPTVLLIHGWGGYKEGWGPLPDTLAGSGFRVVAVDLPGFGDSPAAPSFGHSPRDHAAVIEDAIARLGTEVSVVAHSMGAFPALILAARLPRLVPRLALLGPAPLVATGRRRLAALPFVGARLATAGIRRANRDRAAALRAFIDAAAYPERMRTDPAAIAAAADATERFIRTSPQALGRSVNHALRTNAASLAVLVRQPTLVLVGAQDRVGPPQHARLLAQALPAGRLVVVPDCGHYPFLEAPHAVADALVPFLRAETQTSRMPS